MSHSGAVPMIESGQRRVKLRQRPNLELSRILGVSKPTIVYRGIFSGFSLPIYSSDNEELFFNHSVPRRWDGTSDPTVVARVYLDTANTGKKFQLRLAWEYTKVGTVVPATSNDVDTPVETGTASQYQSFDVSFEIDYDIDGAGNEIVPGDQLGLRIYRIAAPSDEITGEVVVMSAYIDYWRGFYGGA